MKTPLTLAAILVCAFSSFSQDIDVNKTTGLVKVNGKDSFYLVKKNKSILQYDLSLQNLRNEELAFFTTKAVSDLPWDERGDREGTYFLVTFIETANTANVFPEAFSGPKAIAKIIVNANLIRNHVIDPKAERAFVVANNGKLNKEPAEKIEVTINTSAPTTQASTKTSQIVIKNNNIYNNDERIGTFKKITDAAAGITTITIYNTSDLKIATATHNDNDPNADWNLTTLADNKSYQVLYTENASLEKLFRFLTERGWL